MKKHKIIVLASFLTMLPFLAGCGDLIHKHSLVQHDAITPTCTVDGNIEYWTCSGCKKNYSDAQGKTETEDIFIKATGHNFDGQTPIYIWNSTYKQCKASINCNKCDYKEEETASGNKISYIKTSNSSCAVKEKGTFIANFTNSLFTQQIKENIEVGELGAHDFSGQEKKYTWKLNITNAKLKFLVKTADTLKQKLPQVQTLLTQ